MLLVMMLGNGPPEIATVPTVVATAVAAVVVAAVAAVEVTAARWQLVH